MKFGRIGHGPLFRRVPRQEAVDVERLTDKHIARLVKKTALAAGVRSDLTEGERGRKFAGHSLRAGLASSAEVDEPYVQKHLGHASAEMTRRYQRRRDRFRVNLTRRRGCHRRISEPIVGSPPLPRCETLMPKMERGFLLKRFKLKSLSSQPAPGGRAIMVKMTGAGRTTPIPQSYFHGRGKNCRAAGRHRRRRSCDGDGEFRQLPLEGAGSGSDGAILAIAVTHGLGADDAVYLALAQERGLSLATLDWKLAGAARAEGVRVLGPLAEGPQ